MPISNGTETSRRKARRVGAALAISAIVAVVAGLYWHTSSTAASDGQQAATPTIEPASYPTPGKDPSAPPSTRTEFPAGAVAISGPEIVAALSDHTALLPGGFVEYYAPDGTIHGVTQEKHYGGNWTVRQGDFCTVLQGSTDSICSPVERRNGTLYWSMDGEQEASQVIVVPGNPRNLQ